MTEQRIMVLPAELVARVDQNRGDIDRADFINILLDSHLGKTTGKEQEPQNFVTPESLESFEEGMKELLRSFLDFFITYGLEIGKGSGNADLQALTESLKEAPDAATPSRRGKSAIS